MCSRDTTARKVDADCLSGRASRYRGSMQQALLGDWTEQRSSQRSARSKGVQGGNCRRTIPTSQDLSANNCQHIETAEFGRRKKGDKHRTTAPRNGDSELALVKETASSPLCRAGERSSSGGQGMPGLDRQEGEKLFGSP